MGLHPISFTVLCTLSVLSLSLTTIDAKKSKSNKCSTLGFASTLVCSTCNKVAAVVGDEGKKLIKECKGCCQSDGAVSYVEAKFSLCDWKLPQYPEVKTFLDEHAAKYSNLDIEYVRGKNPELIMEDSSGKKTHVNVDRWKTSDIIEYLNSHLQNDS